MFYPADCYNGSDYGLGYNSSVSHTVTGSQCLHWVDANTSFTVERYPELSKAGNSCRNPGQWREVPWCFTADGTVELCGVESCDSHSECVCVRVCALMAYYFHCLFTACVFKFQGGNVNSLIKALRV